MEMNFLESILSVFFLALCVTVVFRQLRLSVILGYLIVGAVVGPNALGWIPNSDNIKELAEFGIVFLMFTVGLEFSLPKLFTLKYPVFFIGGLQVLISILITTLIAKCLGMSTISAVIVGGIVAMSSTAIVVKQLNDQLELHSRHGLNAISILLFQDLAVIPFIILISGLAKPGNISLFSLFAWALIKGILAIFLILFAGKKILRPLFRLISRTRAIELFTLAVLLVTLTAAWLTNLLGLSFALGAFLAGIMLAETEFRHQIEVEIRPFRDILLGLFFITIGMLADISTWSQTWPWILLLVTALLIGKGSLITILCRIAGNNQPESLRTGLVLAQGGEFGFAILTLALTENVIPTDYSQVILAALLLSIAISPIIIYFNKKIATFILSKETKLNEETIQSQIEHVSHRLKHHIIICGYGRVGQNIARMLEKINYPYIGLDLNAELINRASMVGDTAMYGDSTHPAILKASGLDHAKAIVICTDNINATKKILSIVRQSHPTIPIVARCRDEIELAKLKDHGATHVIAELFEESLTISHYLMQILNVPAAKISGMIEEVRNKDYDLLQQVFTGSVAEDSFHDAISNHELRPVLIPGEAYAVNKTLDELNLKSINIEIVAIRHDKIKNLKPHGDVKLHAQDILIIFGELADLENAERIILEG
jgi:CPA2 family monovalent cation:H+ antiporter-2